MLPITQIRKLILDHELRTSNKDFTFRFVDILEAEKENLLVDEGSGEENADQLEEAEYFLGSNPVKTPQELTLRKGLEDKIKTWSTEGIGKKEEEEELLASIPRKGLVNLEAPNLNEEVIVNLEPKVLARDEHLRGCQDLTGAAMASVSSKLNKFLENSKTPLIREAILDGLSSSVKLLSKLFHSLSQARKIFLIRRYEERIQKILKKVQPTTLLFEDNLKALIETSRAIQKVSKELKPRTKQWKSSSLNWRSSTSRKEAVRGSFNQTQVSRPSTSNNSQNSRSTRYKAPARRFYKQSQPQRSRR